MRKILWNNQRLKQNLSPQKVDSVSSTYHGPVDTHPVYVASIGCCLPVGQQIERLAEDSLEQSVFKTKKNKELLLLQCQQRQQKSVEVNITAVCSV